MNTMQNFFDWESFSDTLNCLSRWFSLRIRCDRFIAICINKNPKIQARIVVERVAWKLHSVEIRHRCQLANMKSTAAGSKTQTELLQPLQDHMPNIGFNTVGLPVSWLECLATNGTWYTTTTSATNRNKLRFEVLHWLIPRRQALLYLSQDLDGNSPDFTSKEISLLQAVVSEDGQEASKFWAVANLCFQLSSWGANCSSFFHSCPLSTHSHQPNQPSCRNCVWKNRMAVKLAQGVWIQTFSQELLNMTMGPAHSFMMRLDKANRDDLCEQFSQCKSAMAQRFLQVFSYWKELPWRLCAIATNLFYISDDSEVESTYIEASKLFASEALEMWKNITSSGVRGQAGGQGHGHFQMARLFLDPTFPGNLSAYVVYWASSSDRVMPSALSKELMKYCSALTCMQVLEAQHHYVNQRMSFGRAALPASTCAWLRRRTNADVFDIRFKQNLGEYIGKLPSLLPSSCSSRAETFHLHRKWTCCICCCFVCPFLW